jgi:hypothetical protein
MEEPSEGDFGGVSPLQSPPAATSKVSTHKMMMLLPKGWMEYQISNIYLAKLITKKCCKNARCNVCFLLQ